MIIIYVIVIMLLENVNRRFMKDLAMQNIFTCFYIIYSIDCLVIVIIIININNFSSKCIPKCLWVEERATRLSLQDEILLQLFLKI